MPSPTGSAAAESPHASGPAGSSGPSGPSGLSGPPGLPAAPGLSSPSGPSGPSFSPLYQQIKGLLTRSLQGGEWKPGEAIPSEMELAARFRVSQGTVRKAVDELATENLLVRRQGKGTFVATHAEASTQYRFLRLVADDPAPRGCSGGCSTAGACAPAPTWRARWACAAARP